MKKDFWLERWEREEIGFHQNVINPYLCEYWQELHLACDSMVFVPLCGKSRDMLWLRKQGHQVMGVELSNIAVQAFFKENGYTPHHVARGKFEHCEADGIRILCGDFFDLSKDDLAKVSAVYDRASLIALPPEMRERYVRHLAGILPPATQIPVSYTHLGTESRPPQRRHPSNPVCAAPRVESKLDSAAPDRSDPRSSRSLLPPAPSRPPRNQSFRTASPPVVCAQAILAAGTSALC